MEHETQKSGPKFLKYKPRFSSKLLVLYAVIIGGIGGYLIWHSLALGTVPRYDHVVIVMEENHVASAIVGSANAPYINSIIPQGALFTNSQAITHPSQPNYLELFSGSNQGVTGDSCPHTFSVPNLGSQLIGAGYTFTGYAEDLPGIGSSACSSGNYERKHAPWTDFTNIPSNDSQPFSNFPTDYSKLPTVSFVTPNMMDDMHDGTVAQADTWLKNNLDGYIQWAKTHNSLFIFTTDEGRGSNQNIATFFVGQNIVPGNYSEAVDHHTVLRTLEDMYGLSPLGAAASVNAITDVWNGSAPTPPPTPPPGPPTTDTTPPTISMTAPANGATVSGTVQLTANASDNVGVNDVQFHFDSSTGGDLGPDITKAPYTYSWDTTSATNGQYVLTATAFDAAGNQATAKTITVSVDNSGSGASTGGATGGSNGGATGGDINLTGGKAWVCSGPVNLNRVIITNPTGDGAFFRSGCTGTINYLQITGTSHDGLHVNSGAHDLTINGGMIRCDTPPGVGTPQHFHQDGIQAMGGGPVTFNNFDDQCLTANNSALFINEGAGGNSLPTGIVCNHCILNVGNLYPVRIYNSKDSGVENSIIYKGTKNWINISSGAVNPIDLNNQKLDCPQLRTLDCDGGTGTAPTPPPAQTPTVSLTASPSTVNASNNGTTLTWTSSNVTSCTASGAWSGSKATSGSQATGAIGQTSTYTLTCAGSGGSAVDTATVTLSTAPPPDTTPPTVSITAPAAGSTVKGTLQISAAASDNVGVTGVQFLLNGNDQGAEDTTSPYTTTWNTSTLGNGTYTLTAVARDAAGNKTTSKAVTVTVDNSSTPPTDKTAPTTPSGFKVTATSPSSVTLSWNASTDSGGSGLAGYDIYRGGTLIASTAQLTYTDSGLQAGKAYSYQVAAYDNAGNISTKSSAINATTGNFPITPPPKPTPNPGHYHPGDGDHDGHVNIRDLSFCLELFGRILKNNSFDFNHDGRIDIADLSILLMNFGKY